MVWYPCSVHHHVDFLFAVSFCQCFFNTSFKMCYVCTLRESMSDVAHKHVASCQNLIVVTLTHATLSSSTQQFETWSCHTVEWACDVQFALALVEHGQKRVAIHLLSCPGLNSWPWLCLGHQLNSGPVGSSPLVPPWGHSVGIGSMAETITFYLYLVCSRCE